VSLSFTKALKLLPSGPALHGRKLVHMHTEYIRYTVIMQSVRSRMKTLWMLWFFVNMHVSSGMKA
jgi:hypothetical protein